MADLGKLVIQRAITFEHPVNAEPGSCGASLNGENVAQRRLGQHTIEC